MARFIAAKASEDYVIRLSRLAGADQREIAGKAIYAAADIVTDEVRRRLQGVIKGPSTGDLVASLGIAKMQETQDGYNVKVGFDGYDRNGHPNQLKARVLESGSSKQQKRPFMRPAVAATQKQAVQKMGEVIDEEIARIMNE